MQITLLATLLLAIAGSTLAIDCSLLRCATWYNPVCGTDGKTYGNKCELEIANCFDSNVTLAHKGTCRPLTKRSADDICEPHMKNGGCTREYNPICGSDGKTYANPCTFCAAMYNLLDANQELAVDHRGPCTDVNHKKTANPGCTRQILDVYCTEDEFPLCGSDKKTYGNACKFCKGFYKLEDLGVHLTVEHLGECVAETPNTSDHLQCDPNGRDSCTREYNPVCGSDGKTYANKCVFCKQQRQEGDGGLNFTHFGECTYEDFCPAMSKFGACPYIYSPICASDGKTYPSLCVMCVELYKKLAVDKEAALKLREVSKGACKHEVNAAVSVREAEFETEDEYCETNFANVICDVEEYDPVCASDRKTYRNRCLFCKEMIKQKQDNHSLTVSLEGHCPSDHVCTANSMTGACPDILKPVCGSNGETYANDCELCYEMYTRQKNGENIFIYVKYERPCNTLK